VADLITRQQLIDAGITGSNAKLDQAITNASYAIRAYTERHFAEAGSTSTRTFLYDGSGFLTIDDASSVTVVKLDNQTLTQNLDWLAMPDRGIYTPDVQGVYEWLELPSYREESPQMGFMYNLDTLWWRYKRHHTVDVTGTWGWATVPGDVQQAAIWTAAYFAETPKPYISQTISDYSVTTMQDAPNDAIPERAKALLNPYRRVKF